MSIQRMSEEKIEGFNTQPLMLEIENVIRSGVKTILRDFMTRYELLEKTHNTIMNLPSVRNEMNKSLLDEVTEEPSTLIDKTGISNITDMTRVLVLEEISTVEKKLDVIEKKFAAFGPILDKILVKLHSLNEEVKILKQPSSVDTKTIKKSGMIQPSIVSACENENIKFEIKEEPNVGLEKGVVASTVASTVASLDEEEESVAVLEETEEESVADLEEEEEESVAGLEEEEEEEEEETVAGLEETEEETEEEEVEAEAEATLDEEFFEIEIDDVSYCTNDEENGLIYELTEDGEVGDKVGYLKEGDPFFYADEK
jgi:hypothetical protein